VEIICFCIWDF